ncbi:hypothetical protein OT109_11570 [Phycisphaeraceae bacterium D3-23]
MSPPRSIQTFKGPLDDAFEDAKQHNAPRFVPQSIFADDRGWSYMNQFVGVLRPEGQVNYSVMYPGVVKAWHRHHKQTDFWMVLHGHLKLGVHNEKTGESWVKVIGEKAPGIAIVPPTLWHGGATVGPDNAGLLYFVTHQYDPQNPDEDRRDWDSVEGFPWDVQFK